MELIYKDKLLEAIDNCDYCDHCSLSICLCIGDNFRNEKAIVNLIKDTPAVDAVEVVRCKDCVNSYNCCDGTLRCDNSYEENNMDRVVSDDWFCADGERKEVQE